MALNGEQALVGAVGGTVLFGSAHVLELRGIPVSSEDPDGTVEGPLPIETTLAPNYPNPFNPQTIIPFTLVKPSQVRLAVYDVLGRQIAVLVDGMLPAGQHERTFNAGRLASGVYHYRLETEGMVRTRTMLLVK